MSLVKMSGSTRFGLSEGALHYKNLDKCSLCRSLLPKEMKKKTHTHAILDRTLAVEVVTHSIVLIHKLLERKAIGQSVAFCAALWKYFIAPQTATGHVTN